MVQSPYLKREFDARTEGDSVIQRYKVLAGMLALGEFTVADLARYADVRPTTVRTIIGREKRILRRVDGPPSGRKGGDFHRYTVRDDRSDELRRELEQVYNELGAASTGARGGAAPQAAAPNAANNDVLPLDLMAAADTLARLFPAAKEAEAKRALLESAEASFERARREVASLAGTVPDKDAERLALHVEVVDQLKDLARTEMAFEQGDVRHALHDFANTGRRLSDAALRLRQLGDNELVLNTYERLNQLTNHLVAQVAPARARATDASNMGSVILIDGIPSKRDALTPKIRAITEQRVGDLVKVDAGDLTLVTQVSSDQSSPLCFMTVDSSSPASLRSVEPLIRALPDCQGPGDHMVVFDRKSSPQMRNLALSGGAHYVADALTGNLNDAVSAALRMTFGTDAPSSRSGSVSPRSHPPEPKAHP